jgi:PQQ-dependent dehydrogenase (methanol/ethanol family)
VIAIGARLAGRSVAGAGLVALLALAAGCRGDGGERVAAGVDGAAIVAADPAHWLSHGRGYDEQRFSPLTQITAGNVTDLGLAWSYDLDFNRGQEATPLIADGVLFATGAWGVVYALDAATGRLRWKHDPQVNRLKAQHACCDVVNRGVALWQGRVIYGTLDGRLEALDAATGRLLWTTQTLDAAQPYTITGAPRVVKGKVIIGNGGAEYGVRGYVSAYDAADGKLLWRFHTVPGDPALGYESPVMERAAATWTGEWWKYGGGGTVWDSMAYDPELDLLYVGVGNGSPWNRKIRSPGGGDNLFLSSIVALRPDTGEYVWHYQTTPGETWDYTATQHIVLATLTLDGRPRKVLMQAPKNGFFYVLDRATGELLTADPFVTVTWATGVDLRTGRPVEAPNARYEQGPAVLFPSPHGAHNWHPMSYHPGLGLVYIPAQDVPFAYADARPFVRRPGLWNPGIDPTLSELPEDPVQRAGLLAMIKGYLIAWDPVLRRAVWTHEHPGAFNGGLLSTGGNLVFQGDALGNFVAYRADDGRVLWRAPAGSGIVAAPVSYAIDGQQYVSVLAGWGGAYAVSTGGVARANAKIGNVSRILTYKLGGRATLPPDAARLSANRPQPPADPQAAPERIAAGRELYYSHCMVCHGESVVSGSSIPDLRYMDVATHAGFAGIVQGTRADKGMPSFAPYLDPAQIADVHAYVIDRARAELARLDAGS